MKTPASPHAALSPGVHDDATMNGWRSQDEIDDIIQQRREKALRHFEHVSRGLMPRTCPICGYEGLFSPVRHKVDVWCPSCDSRSRHRLFVLWLEQAGAPFHIGSILHFAAEPCLVPALRDACDSYVTADINDQFDLQLNIEAIDQPDESHDMVIANHVLEHVDDQKALAEMARILRPGGLAVITVPMIEGWRTSFEDPGFDDPEIKALVMSDPDHRRWYGRDIQKRIEAAGLEYSEFIAVEPSVRLHGLARAEKIFFGRKPG